MRPTRTRFRFSVGIFLILATLIAGLLAVFVHRAHTQRAAVESIRAARGNVLFDYHETGPRSWSTGGKPRGPEWLRKILGEKYFDRPIYVSLFSTSADQTWIDGVNDLGSIKTLMITGPNVNDDTLARLRGSNTLLSLHLTHCSITDEGLAHLAKFPNLRWLILNETTLTDSGMVHLSKLHCLEELNLKNTKVSDASIPSIADFPNLQHIDLRGTRITAPGKQRIIQKNTRLTVLR